MDIRRSFSISYSKFALLYVRSSLAIQKSKRAIFSNWYKVFAFASTWRKVVGVISITPSIFLEADRRSRRTMRSGHWCPMRRHNLHQGEWRSGDFPSLCKHGSNILASQFVGYCSIRAHVLADILLRIRAQYQNRQVAGHVLFGYILNFTSFCIIPVITPSISCQYKYLVYFQLLL